MYENSNKQQIYFPCFMCLSDGDFKATTQTTSFEMSLSKHVDNWAAAAAAEGYNNVCWDLTALHMTDCPKVAVTQSMMEWSPGVRGTQSRQGHPPSKRSFPCFTTLHLHLCKDVTYHCSCPYKHLFSSTISHYVPWFILTYTSSSTSP